MYFLKHDLLHLTCYFWKLDNGFGWQLLNITLFNGQWDAESLWLGQRFHVGYLAKIDFERLN